jgi:hypothetical protein
MEARVARLEDDMREVKAVLTRIEPMIVRIDATMPHLATKAELADLGSSLRGEFGDLRSELRGEVVELRSELHGEVTDLRSELRSEVAELRSELRSGLAAMPSKIYMCGVLGVLIATYAAGLAALAVIR